MRKTGRKQKAAPARATRPVRRKPAAIEDDIYRLITEAIVAKQLRPGTRLKEAALAEQFGVNRARVHKALLRLAEMQMIEFRFNQGAMVSRPSTEEARAVFRTRRVLEEEAVRATSQHAGRQHYAELRRLIEREKKAFTEKPVGLVSLSSQFHLMLGDMCGNPVLARILLQLVHRCVLIQSLYERPAQHTICLTHEHSEIVDLLEQGDVEGAVSAMEAHLNHIEASLDYDSATSVDDRVLASIA
jgi:DNA-binding GntR family transcriptional regulator